MAEVSLRYGWSFPDIDATYLDDFLEVLLLARDQDDGLPGEGWTKNYDEILTQWQSRRAVTNG